MGTAAHLELIETESVTGFLTRAALMADLEAAIAAGRPATLAIFGLDGSEEFRKNAGDRASDEAIGRIADEFGRIVRPDGTCYSSRRHEMCVLFHLTLDRVSAILATAAIAVRREGAIFSITTAFGVAVLPQEADNPLAALIVADTRRRRRLGTGGAPTG